MIEEVRRLARKYIEGDAVYDRVSELLTDLDGLVEELLAELEHEHNCTEVSVYRTALAGKGKEDE